MATFEENMDVFMHMFAFVLRDMKSIRHSVPRRLAALRRNYTRILEREIKPFIASAQTSDAARVREGAEKTKGLEKLQATLKRSEMRLLERQSEGTARLHTATAWQTVMLVTCTETYLEDLLSSAAAVDPKIMRRSRQRVSFADIFSTSSMEKLTQDLGALWSREFVNEGGPRGWITRLKKMGVKGYQQNLVPRLKRVWDTRNVIVHGAGKATPEFSIRYPDAVLADTGRIAVDLKQLGDFARAVEEFVTVTDAAFIRRFPQLAVAARKLRTKTGYNRPSRPQDSPTRPI